MTNPPARVEPPLDRLTPRQRRRVVLLGLLRALVSALILVTLYFIIPLEWVDDLPVAVAAVFAAVVLVGVSAWQVLAIIRAAEPGLRAISALAIIAPLYLLLFAAMYFLMELGVAGSFTAAMSRLDALYFTVTVFATVGFGDIAAVSESARALVTVQMVLNLIILGAGLRLLTVAVKHGQAKPERTAAS
ncbi:potassium channel family protein [Microbacterium sp. CFBP9034]|uniref:potassium channel family protein n=1 Tax=Microbacterium sp. CFBP9034 TaxID=3096540 RepID=UPI002A6A3B74|nr:potassium channel family protein [Microbacterium sp. CFBP9034]MDY0910185.1 potassium channel family protein [Microbacterium sp. CFBP9034]